MKEIIINKGNQTETVALLENGKLIELYESEVNSKLLEGNIYCGKVKDILPGMQSAFIDIGEDKNAFINIKDIVPKTSNETGNKGKMFENYNIKDYINTNMPILVQVKKDQEDQKGAKVSKHINLTGRYSVLMPNVNFVTISQKISNENERMRLKSIGKEILQTINSDTQKYGIILRTASENTDKNKIVDEVEDLKNTWNDILIKYNESKSKDKITKIYESDDIATRIIISTLNNEEYKIATNDQKIYTKIEKIINQLQKPNIKIEIVYDNLMNIDDLQEQIEKSKQRKVWLNCGGFITIDKTEALTAIDINSGKYIGKKHDSKENAIYKVNKEATIEIAKQLKLRNIGGIIVIDYIDMEKDEEKDGIVNILKTELMKDRSKTEICGFTKLNLLEMTRKRM